MRRASLSIGLFSIVFLIACSTPAGARGCPDDADCDGIPDAVEAAVGPQGFSPAPGTAVVSAVLAPDGSIEFEFASAILPGQAGLVFPPGTSAGSSPITLDFGPYGAAARPAVLTDGAQLAVGLTKEITVTKSSASQTVLAFVDEPGASRTDLLTAPPGQRFVIPPCPCPASTSVNSLGDATPYTVTNLDDTEVRISGLLFSAVGLSETLTPLPALSTPGLVIGVGALLAIGAAALVRRRRAESLDPA